MYNCGEKGLYIYIYGLYRGAEHKGMAVCCVTRLLSYAVKELANSVILSSWLVAQTGLTDTHIDILLCNSNIYQMEDLFIFYSRFIASFPLQGESKKRFLKICGIF